MFSNMTLDSVCRLTMLGGSYRANTKFDTTWSRSNFVVVPQLALIVVAGRPLSAGPSIVARSRTSAFVEAALQQLRLLLPLAGALVGASAFFML